MPLPKGVLMRFSAILTSALFANVAFAGEGMLGTKGSGATAFQPTQQSGGGFLQMIVAVIIVVVAMKFLLPKILSPKMLAKLGGKLHTDLNSAIKIEESANFPGGTLHLVTVKGRVLLLGTTPTSISTLADLGSESKPDPGTTFMEMLDTAVIEAPEPEFAVIAEKSEAELALERLQRLMK